ncbi:hypothetical protein DM02DRAFT_620115 [Periconia macrospinosa]|uniref:Mid2 domain-containing protein n=1 Tax=Periconia macrospinosa TaxID=97972 RepID=A0A2V1D4I8_9PLEO|nr:hypothetical protein DM02DRAFT_620115 [Periconia macrospinosa]
MKAAVATLLIAGSLVNAKCYLPDGTGATNPQWRECSTDPQDPLSNICCALNRTNAAGGLKSEGETADTCLPNGLCQNESVMDSGNKTIYYRRSYCTSQQWESGNCLTTCGKGGTGFKDMTPCDGTSTSERWCCGTNTDCCNDPKGQVVILAKKFMDASPTTVIGTAQPSTTSKSSSASQTSAAAVTTAFSGNPPPSASEGTQTTAAGVAGSPPSSAGATSSAPSPSASSQDTQGMTTGAKVGIAVGAVVGAAALVGIGAWLALSSQRRKRNDAPYAQSPPELDGYSGDRKEIYMLQQNSIHEASSQNHSYPASMHSHHHYNQPPVPLGELPVQQMRSELPGDEGKPEKGRHW